MNPSLAKSNYYYITAAVRKALKDLYYGGHDSLVCSGLLSHKNKRLNSIQSIEPGKFPKILLSYIHSEEPDKVQVDINDSEGHLVWTRIFRIVRSANTPEPIESSTLGKAELDAMVNEKLSQLRQEQELEQLRSRSQDLEDENEQLKSQLEEVEKTLEAKNTIEHLMSLAGTYGPKILGMLRANPAPSGGLSGSQVSKVSLNNDQQAVWEMTAEFLMRLSPEHTENFYYLLVELSNQPEQLPELIRIIHAKNTSHEV